jgi:aspartyl-tRNA(Asn)/glutamyl-tRNA(Gln) amidotransferase subunit C
MDSKELKKLAHLARIGIGDGELEGLQKDLEQILTYVSQIQKVTKNSSVFNDMIELRNVMRKDENPHEAGLYSDALLQSVPQTEKEYVKVKKIL